MKILKSEVLCGFLFLSFFGNLSENRAEKCYQIGVILKAFLVRGIPLNLIICVSCIFYNDLG